MVCNKCHDPHGSGNLQMIRAGIWYDQGLPPIAISFSNRSTFVKYAAPYDGLCQTCHTQTAHFKRGVVEPAGAGQHGNIANRNCTACHQHGVNPADTVTYAFQSPRCDNCHGYPPVRNMAGFGRQSMFSTAKLQNYTNSGGAHTAFGHLAPSIKATDPNPWQSCQPCHAGGAATHRLAAASAQVQISSTYKAKSGSAEYASTCSNVSCHGGASAASGASPAWTDTPGWLLPNGDINLFPGETANFWEDTVCLQCHAINTTGRSPGTPENNSAYSGRDPIYETYWLPDPPPYSNLHDRHLFVGQTCTDCHDASSASLGKGSNHFASLSSATMGRAWQTLNKTFIIDYTPDLPVGRKGTCTTAIGCHDVESSTRVW